MHYLNHNLERALYATGVLAGTFWRAITTIRQAKCEDCSAPAVTKSCEMCVTLWKDYLEQASILQAHQLEKSLRRGTGLDMPTGEEAHWPAEPAFKFSNDDGTKLYRTADGLGMTTSGTNKIELVYRKECECKES